MAVSDLNKARAIKAQLAEESEARRQRARLEAEEIENFGRVSTPLLLITLLMVAYGLIMLFSASLSQGYAEFGDPLYFVKRQFNFTLFGLFLCFVIARLTPIRLYNRPYFMAAVYTASILMLLLVLFRGTEGDFGGMRWLRLGPIKFQPSEACKVTSVYCLSQWFAFIRKSQQRGHFKTTTPQKQRFLDGRLYICYPMAASALMLLLILVQPHLSGTVIVFTLCASIFFLARIPLKVWLAGLAQILPVILAGALLLSLVFPIVDKEKRSLLEFAGEKFAHVSQRMSTFQNPDEATSDQIHQVLQSRYALGSGGLSGKGLGMGRQKSGFLPMVYNDYILPSIGEELGFLGTLSVLILFLAFFAVGTSIALKANSLFAAGMAWGCTILITVQALLNIAVASEVIPSTGISLPFFSYGGTASIFFFVAVGFVLCVSRSGQKVDPEIRRILDERHGRTPRRAAESRRPQESAGKSRNRGRRS